MRQRGGGGAAPEAPAGVTVLPRTPPGLAAARKTQACYPDPAETWGQKIGLHKFNANRLAVENDPGLTFPHQQQRRKVQCVLCLRWRGLQRWSFAACS